MHIFIVGMFLKPGMFFAMHYTLFLIKENLEKCFLSSGTA